MDYAQHISSLVLSIRKKEKLRVRLPLKRILLPVLDDRFQEDVDHVKELILAEVNVKDIEYISGTSNIVSKKAKPNFKTLGKRLGKDMKAAADLIQSFDQDQIAKFENDGRVMIHLAGNDLEINKDDIEIISEDIPGWQVASEDGITVALDIHLDDDLITEGTARELVNRIQNLRKNSGFNVTDRIHIVVQERPLVGNAVGQFADYIKSETLADTIRIVDVPNGHSLTEVEWLEGDTIGIEIIKA
jgi:isoleucyl-tRNA synthetase